MTIAGASMNIINKSGSVHNNDIASQNVTMIMDGIFIICLLILIYSFYRAFKGI
jgi:hypothetical protein